MAAKLRAISLFSGVGGMDLGLERAGIETVFQRQGARAAGRTRRLVMPDKGRFAAVLQHGVRRLTPLECERLQGWPDDWTRWDAEGNEIADSHRYRMAGNGVASPVAEWIGHRIVAIEEGISREYRNKRDVWTVATKPYREAHFATYPEELVEPCILAGTAAGGVVLDPFLGSGTTLAVAKRLGRRGIGIELNPDYIELAKRRCEQMGMALDGVAS